jgi:hypothetical protein
MYQTNAINLDSVLTLPLVRFCFGPRTKIEDGVQSTF